MKQAMIDTIMGRPTAQIPWVPRLDLWYRANKRANRLPEGFHDATLAEIATELDAGLHMIVPDFLDNHCEQERYDRGLGVYNLWCMPCRTIFENVDRSLHVEGERTIVEYRTPLGTIRTVSLYDEGMKNAGITITHVEEYAFKNADDYAALGFLFENARVESNYEGYLQYAARAGGRGLAAGFISLAASPMHLIQRELMPLETFFYEQYDHPEELARLAGKIACYWERLLDCAAGCPAEVFLLGANYDARVTYPPFFQQHIKPWLKQFSEMIHPAGRYLLTHTDGENAGLLEQYCHCGIDVADSVCPSPMTSLTLKQTRDVFSGKGITIMGGIPSVATLPDCMPDAEFQAFLDDFFSQLGRGDHLILGISDTTPPGADFQRLRMIGQRIREFGPVRPSSDS